MKLVSWLILFHSMPDVSEMLEYLKQNLLYSQPVCCSLPKPYTPFFLKRSVTEKLNLITFTQYCQMYVWRLDCRLDGSNWLDSQQRQNICLLCIALGQTWGPTSLLSSGHWELFHQEESNQASLSPLSGTKFKTVWSYTSTLSFSFIEWCLLFVIRKYSLQNFQNNVPVIQPNPMSP